MKPSVLKKQKKTKIKTKKLFFLRLALNVLPASVWRNLRLQACLLNSFIVQKEPYIPYFDWNCVLGVMAKPVERSHSLIWYVKCSWDLEAVKQDPCEVTESPELWQFSKGRDHNVLVVLGVAPHS